MAGFLGNLDLFSEFDKEREATASFIHYDEESVKSRIVFEDYASDNESSTDDEFYEETKVEDEAGKKALASTEDETSSKKEIVKDEDSSSADTIITEDVPAEGKGDEGKGDEAKSNGEKKAEVKKETSTPGVLTLSAEDEERTAWLNEQLYAEAAEEASKSDISVQHLIYQRNKFRRYAKILDSTRYVPDDESPAVQLIFNNNSFARKYRQQIEQFIKSLLWEEFHSSNQDSMSEITVKPGAPSCMDINDTLTPEQRTEKMRQKHALIGNSQFHKQFLIDFLGWPFTVAEPTRCNVNWEIPLYGQVFNEVYADPTNKSASSSKKQPPKKPKPACWNCGEENHSVSDCRHPRNPAKISANRREFLTQQQQSQQNFEPKFTGPSRYHMDPELASKFVKFKPGTVSDSLREALGLTQDQLPQHIYKMRLFGYPPGWLAEAKQVESGVNIFDKNGRVTLITGECLEDGELDEEGAESKTEYDVNKIIEFPGFTIPVPLGYVDEHATFKMPPIQQHQLKKTLMSQSSEKATAKKRKRAKDKADKEESAKKAKLEGEEGEAEEGEVGDTQGEGEKTEEGDEEMESPAKQKPAKKETTPHLPRSSSTVSLSKDFGTPILVREKSDLPDASKFGQGIEDHLPFENLPNSTGTFEKMKDLLELIRNKTRKVE